MDRYSFEDTETVGEDVASQRDAARDSLFLAAKLVVDGLPAEQVRVRNLSAGGLMAEYPSPVEPGARVAIDLRGVGEIGGRVAWAAAGRIGIAFDAEIDPMLARKPVGTRNTPTR